MRALGLLLGFLLIATALLLPLALPMVATALPTEDATTICAAPLGNAAESLRLAPVAWSPPCPAPTLSGTDATPVAAVLSPRPLPAPAPRAVESSRLL